jgi:hypothetical protein
MLVDVAHSTWQTRVSCVWVENRQKQATSFDAQSLQTVYADGTPRDYSKEK